MDHSIDEADKNEGEIQGIHPGFFGLGLLIVAFAVSTMSYIVGIFL